MVKVIEPKEKKKMYNRYFKRVTMRDGIRFLSKKAANRYDFLKELRKRGDVSLFVVKPKLQIPDGSYYTPTFLIQWADGRMTLEDATTKRSKVGNQIIKNAESFYKRKIDRI